MIKEDFEALQDILKEQSQIGSEIRRRKKEIKELREKRDTLAEQVEARLHGFKEYKGISSHLKVDDGSRYLVVVIGFDGKGEPVFDYGIANYTSHGWQFLCFSSSTNKRVIAYRKLRKAKNYLIQIGTEEEGGAE